MSETKLNFVDIQRFLLNDMKMQANYQPIMIRTLLTSPQNIATKDEIAKNIKELNPDRDDNNFKDIPVYEVLLNHGIVKKVGDKFALNSVDLTEYESHQLTVLCNWKTETIPLHKQLQELIKAFDENKLLFDPERPSHQQLEKLRLDFISYYSKEKISNLQLDEYVVGKEDPNSGDVNRTTFCYRLEKEMSKLSRFGVRTAEDFGIYFSKKENVYRYSKKYSTPQQAFEKIRNRLLSIIEEGKEFQTNHDIQGLIKKLEEDPILPKTIISKILSIYYPEDFVHIHSFADILIILHSLGAVVPKDLDNLFLAQAQLLEIKNSDSIMKNWNMSDFSHFAWCVVKERFQDKKAKLSEQIGPNPKLSQGVSIWLVRAGDEGQGEKIALEKNVIGIGYGGLPELDSIKDYQAFKDHYKNTHQQESKGRIGRVVPQIWNFMNVIKKNDLVLLPLKTQPGLVAIGKIISDYKYQDLNDEIKQFRSVEWIKKDVPRVVLDSEINEKLNTNGTVSYIGDSVTFAKVLEMLSNLEITKPEILIDNETRKIESRITLEDVANETFLLLESLKEIEDLLNEKKQIIFYGPPGTGKTYLAKKFSKYFVKDENNIEIVQFHQSYSYEDFVEGIRPNLSESGEAVGFSRQPGIFKELVRKSINNPSKKFMLIIDEINRGNISKIFGELIYLLEYRDEKISLTYSPNDKFYIPSNLYIIGTMNSADRSIAFVDYALRRRFYFIEFYPESRILDTSILYKWLIKHNVEKSVAEKIELMLQEINLKIKEKLDMEHQIGYSHFLVKDLNEDRLRKIINYALIPLVEQYFYGRKDIVDDIKRICNNTLTIFSSNKINPTT